MIPDDDNSGNENDAKRRRCIPTPIDSTLVNRRVMRTTTITLAELLQENLDLTVNMNKRHVDVQIMRVITPQANQNAVTRYTRSNQQNEARFNRFILCFVIAEASSARSCVSVIGSYSGNYCAKTDFFLPPHI